MNQIASRRALDCVIIVIPSPVLYLIQYCFGISNVAKLLKSLDSETEGSGFSSGSIQNDKSSLLNIVTMPAYWRKLANLNKQKY